MQLVAYGAQDVYLTGNPQITFFKVVYRRHTNFATETIEQPIDSAKPGGRYLVTIQRNGDLCTQMCYRVEIPQITSGDVGSGVQSIAWVRRLGHALIDFAEVQIGGSPIDKHYGIWLDIWYELTHTFDQERGYSKLIGDDPALTTLSPVTANASDQVLPDYTLYIPFQFWFCRNTGLALPLIALQYHEVRINLQLNPISRLMVWTGSSTPNLGNFTFNSSGVMVDYVYLDSEERRRFAQVGHEYLIEQLQFPGSESLYGNSTAAAINQKFKLTFNHPCKEIIWALQVGAFNGQSGSSSFQNSNSFLAYTNKDDEWDNAVEDAAKGLVESLIQTSSTGAVLIPYLLSNTIVLGNAAATVLNITFSNFYNGQTQTPIIPGPPGPGQPQPVYYVNSLLGNGTFDFLNNIAEADIVITYNGSLPGVPITAVECTALTHTVQLRDLSIPLTQWTVDNMNLALGVHTVVYNVVQPSNYGLQLDGQGNPVESGNIQLNGHDRFEIQEGAYFNYLQPLRCHTRTPADGINVYCFALHPEQHQPSGSANLSRIDTTLLVLTFSDPLRPRGSGIPNLDYVTNTNVYIFATNYNVLRIMSGMGGLAYSN